LSIKPSDGASGLPIQAVDEEFGLVALFSNMFWMQVDSMRPVAVYTSCMLNDSDKHTTNE
jgi:hypothetical protein